MSEPTIEVRANKLGGIAGKEWHHSYIVYTDEKGDQCFIRGGPTQQGIGIPGSEISGGASRAGSIQASGSGSNTASVSDHPKGGGFYGVNRTDVEWLDKRPGSKLPIDYHPEQGYESVVVSRGPQCEQQFKQICAEMNAVQATNTRYSPFGPNSNTCVADGLRAAKIDPKLPDGVWAPGFEQHIDTSKVTQAQRDTVARDGQHSTQKPWEPEGEKKDPAREEAAARRRELKEKMREASDRGPEISKSSARG